MKNTAWQRCVAVCLAVCLLCVAAYPTSVAGAAEKPADASDYQERVQVGFNGVYRTGSWTPLVVLLPAPAATADPSAAAEVLHVWVEDPDGQYLRSPPVAAIAAPDGTRAAHFCVRFGRPTARVMVEHAAAEVRLSNHAKAASEPVSRAGLRTHSLAQPIDSTQTVLLVLGDLPSAERAVRLLSDDTYARPRVVSITSNARAPSEVPSIWGCSPRDFDGVDAMVVCGQSAAVLDAAVIASIDGWVQRGGQLVFAAGVSALPIQQSGSSLSRWLPGKIERMLPLRRLAAIEAYARASRPLEKNALAGFEVPVLENASAISGTVEAFAGKSSVDLPLVVRRAYGFGTLTWIGIDIDHGAFRSWPGTDTLLCELLGGRSNTNLAGRAGEHRSALDLAGQLRTAIDHFPSVQAVPFEIIAGLAVLYIVCLYPLDWWLVSRGARRPWLAWLSLPLLVCITSGLAWSTALRWKGAAWQSSSAGVMDVDVASRLARGVSYAGVWSPVNAVMNVSAHPTAAAPLSGSVDTVVSWYGAAGRGIGGTDAVLPHPSLAAADYTYNSSLHTLAGIAIAASSSRLFEAEWFATVADTPVESHLSCNAQGTLSGSLTSRLPFPLEQCLLVHAGWMYDVGPLDPGSRYEPTNGRGPRSLAGALTRRLANKDRDVAVRWEASSCDTDRILEIAGFYAAAGGSAYTTLTAGRLGRIDLSPLLEMNRVVLVGRGPIGTAWVTESDEKTDFAAAMRLPATGGSAAVLPAVLPTRAPTTVWRIVIPLDKQSATVSTE